MDLLDQQATEAEKAAGAPTDHDDDHALLGLPPGVSAPLAGDHAGATALAPAAQAAQQIQWYHLDPDAHYEELRTGVGPGLGRGLAFGGGLSVLAVALFYFCMWMIEPSAALLNPFVDRSYAEARDDMLAHLGGLAPIAAAASTTTTQPTAATVTPKFDISDLRAAHQPSASGSGGGYTWYRFDLPREQVPAYRKHLVSSWLVPLKHRIEEGGADAAFDSRSGPPWWEANEFDRESRLRLIRSDGQAAFHAAFSAARGRVYVRVNH